MRTSTIVATTLFAAALWLATVPAAQAAPPETDPQAAKAHADRGMTFYNLSDWPAAIREFRDAFKADPRPEYLFSKAQAERHRGDYSAAILSYKAFLRTSDTSPARVAATEALIKECETKIEEERLAEADRREAERLDREEKARELRKLSTPSVTATTATAPVHHSWTTDAAGLTLFFGGAAVAGTGVGLFLWGNSEMRASANQETYQQYETNVSGAKTKRILGIVGIGTGAALLATGIIRFAIVASRSPKEGTTAYLVVSPTSIGVHGQF